MNSMGISDRRGSRGDARVRYVTGARTAPSSPGHARVMAEVRRAQLPATVGHRLRVTAASVALVILAILVLSAPLSVTIPIGIVLGAGLAISAVVALVDRRTRADARP